MAVKETISWCGYTWLNRERWGRIHPDSPRAWNDPNMIEIRDGMLVLKTGKSPMSFVLDGKKVTTQVGMGLVSNQKKFGYGYFEIECKLPTGKQLWPAFWMWSFDSWPPEIDVFEAYTRKTKGYFKIPSKFWRFLGFWDVKTNIHYGHEKDNTKGSTGALSHWFGFKNPRKHFMKYGCLWTEDKIDIFYNGRKVRTIDDPEVIKYFKGTTMNVIINSHVDYGIDEDNPTKSEFIIKSFNYTPLHKYNG